MNLDDDKSSNSIHQVFIEKSLNEERSIKRTVVAAFIMATSIFIAATSASVYRIRQSHHNFSTLLTENIAAGATLGEIHSNVRSMDRLASALVLDQDRRGIDADHVKRDLVSAINHHSAQLEKFLDDPSSIALNEHWKKSLFVYNDEIDKLIKLGSQMEESRRIAIWNSKIRPLREGILDDLDVLSQMQDDQASFREDQILRAMASFKWWAIMLLCLGTVAIALVANFVIRTLGRKFKDQRASQVALLGSTAAEEAARQSASLKSAFLANMSHEIRTPMNGVIGMTELLIDTPLKEDQQDFVNTIKVSAESLLTIINDILDFSKIEAGKIELEVNDFALRSSIEDAVDLMSEQARSKNLELISHIEADVPDLLRGDAGRIRQIVINLLSNALKFTARGEVRLHVSVLKAKDFDCELQVSITDSGIGISPEKQAQLFSPFTQADASTVRKYGGTGLGLAISKQLVNLMNGSIRIDSSEGRGSVFTFTMRLAKQATPAPENTQFKDIRALVVDDNSNSLKSLASQFEFIGMKIDTAPSGAVALQKVRAAHSNHVPYQFIFVDREMPELAAAEFARHIQTEKLAAQNTLILLNSGARLSPGKVKAIGFASAIMKPVKQLNLEHSLKSVLPGHTEVTEDDWLQEASSPTLAHSGLRILAVEDNSTNQKLIALQLQKLGYEFDMAANGTEAIHALRQTHYDLILMDGQMPEMDGYEATREIRRMEGNKARCPIIAMTANALLGDKEKCLEAGMDDYVSKPLEIKVLSQKLQQWTRTLSVIAPTPEIAELQTIPSATAYNLQIVNVELLHERFAEIREALAPSIQDFVETVPQLLSELNHAINLAEFSAIEKAAHNIKGAAMIFCAEQAITSAMDIEEGCHSENMKGVLISFNRLQKDISALTPLLKSLVAEDLAA